MRDKGSEHCKSNPFATVFMLFFWQFKEKGVPLQQQFPPRLLTMRTTAGLRYLYRYEI